MVSPVSGSIFEKRLIEKYVTENGVDPITGKELTIDQLIDIKSMLFVLRRYTNSESRIKLIYLLSSYSNSDS